MVRLVALNDFFGIEDTILCIQEQVEQQYLVTEIEGSFGGQKKENWNWTYAAYCD